MSTVINTNSEYQSNSLRKKFSFRRDGSYRIYHITKKQKEESDDDDDGDNFYTKTGQSIDKEYDIKSKYQKKSFKISNRNGLDGWKRKSFRNKSLLFLQKASCESTSNEIKTPPSVHPLANDLSLSIIHNDAASCQLLKKNKQYNIRPSLESDALIEAIDETEAHNDATLDDLLTRAAKLETTVKKQDFSKNQPLSRASYHRRRKRFIIACSTVLITLTIIITIILTIRYKAQTNQIPKSSSIHDLE